MHHKNKKKEKVKIEKFAYKQIIYYCLVGVSVMLALLFFFLAFAQYEFQLVRGGDFSSTSFLIQPIWFRIMFSLLGVFTLALSAGFLLLARRSRLRGSSNMALDEDNKKLREMLLQNQEKLQKMFELCLIKGEKIHHELFDEFIKDFELSSFKFFSVLSAVFDKGKEDLIDVDENEICRGILKKMPDQLKKLACLPPISNGCIIISVFAGYDKEVMQEQLKNYYSGLEKLADEEYDCHIIAGISSVHEQVDAIFTAYKESISALASVAIDSGTKTTLPDMHNDMHNCYIYQPASIISTVPYDCSYEEEVRAGLRTIERERCVKALEDFSNFLLQVNQQDKIIVYVMRFTEVILFTAMEVNVDLNVICPDELDRVFTDLFEIPEPGRIKRYLLNHLIDPILEARNQLLEKKSYSMLENIEQLIRSRKGDISLTECAEILGVHPTYIWKITKAEKGQTFSDYLEKYKLEEAKRLLLETDLTVAEIAMELNYTNAQNFIRFFNKNTGMTPGKYRKQHK